MAAHFSQVLKRAIIWIQIICDQFTNSPIYIEINQNFQDTVNLPKVADLFWSHADEEREHAKAFINYLRMRCKTLKPKTKYKAVTFQGSDKQ